MATSTSRVLSFAGLVLAGLVAIASLAGITVPSIYGRETPLWAAQGIGQDWIDLVVVSPVVAVCALLARRGSRTAQLAFAGALIYLLYSFVLYAFAVHFNRLFLVYVATLGIAFYLLIGLALALHRQQAMSWFRTPPPLARAAGAFLIVVAAAFALLWLSDVIPALVRGSSPAGLDDVGLATNPIYVIDLAVILPALLATGIMLIRKQTAAFVVAPILLAFNVLMTGALLGMFVAMRQRGLSTDLAGPTVSAILCAASGALFVALTRPLRPLREPAAVLGDSRLQVH